MSKALNSLIGTVFPKASLSKLNVESREVLSSTYLHSLVYYNMYYSIIYFVLNVLILRWKSLNFVGWRIQGVTTVMFLMWSFAEPARLYAGYLGNLQEKVPSLVAFVFLTVFPQFVCCFFMVLLQKPMLPIDKVLNVLMMIFLVAEVLMGYYATNLIIVSKTARFAVEYGRMDDEEELEMAAMRRDEKKDEEKDEDDTDSDEGLDDLAKLQKKQKQRHDEVKKNMDQRSRREKERAYLRRKRERERLKEAHKTGNNRESAVSFVSAKVSPERERGSMLRSRSRGDNSRSDSD